jgi:hypothetical protein
VTTDIASLTETASDGQDWEPKFSPDGSEVVFTRYDLSNLGPTIESGQFRRTYVASCEDRW